MKALVYHAPAILKYEEVPEQPLRSGEVRIRPKAVGICGSDVHGYLGLTGRRTPPMIMGHEFAGVVDALGPDVSGWKKGERVAVYPVYYCGECGSCRVGDTHLCRERRQFGVLSENGAFADYINVPAKCCYRLTDAVSFAVGCMMEPLAVSYRAVGKVPPETVRGKTVFMVGAGTIGLLALACVKMLEPAAVIVSDMSDSRLAVAGRMGADRTINPGAVDVAAFVREHTGGRGADVAIEAVGAGVTVNQAMAALRPGGVAVWIGNNKPTVEINMQEVVTRELSIHGSFLYGRDEFRTVVELLNTGKITADPIISHVADMSEGPALFEKLAHEPGDWIKVILTNA